MSVLTYNSSEFLLDNKKITIVSGAVHYFRIVPELWEDRIKKLKQCGLNTVETVIPWNLHEKSEGVYDFTGILDIKRYIDIAKQNGLYVILRPGPYICAEHDMGGLPSRLLTIPGLKLRCMNEPFLKEVRRWYKALFDEIRPCFIENGGNIIALQLENEYGSFGDDTEYMAEIEKIYRENDIPCLFFTSDGPGYFMLSGGTRENVLACINFGSNPKDNFALLRKFQKDKPEMCMEYWNGWFDHWYEEHHTRDAGDTADVFKEMLEGGHSVNFYMFHGGTNFGFNNGANFDKYYQPTVTSYDYNCPVSECGDLTPKYFAIHDVMEQFLGHELPIEVGNSKKRAYGTLELTERAELFKNLDVLGTVSKSSVPESFEEAGQKFGYMLYETEFRGPFEKLDFSIDGLNDRACVYANDELLGIKENTGHRDDRIILGADFDETVNVKILVENMGRVNYGGHIVDRKGITGGVRIANRFHFGWKNISLPMDGDFSKVRFEKMTEEEINKPFDKPAFYRGWLKAEEACDTFVKLPGFTKGVVYVNGFNLGRFFNPAGPQKTLYIPGPLLKIGDNEIIVFESDKYSSGKIQFVDKEEL